MAGQCTGLPDVLSFLGGNTVGKVIARMAEEGRARNGTRVYLVGTVTHENELILLGCRNNGQEDLSIMHAILVIFANITRAGLKWTKI